MTPSRSSTSNGVLRGPQRALERAPSFVAALFVGAATPAAKILVLAVHALAERPLAAAPRRRAAAPQPSTVLATEVP